MKNSKFPPAYLAIFPSEIQAEKCAGSLYEYVRAAWHLVEPQTPFMDNWHIGLICEYLQAVTDLEIHNLIINVPPRHMKSLLVSVFWPTWSWINTPHLRWLTGSYATPLAVRDALKSRRILQSGWYQRRFGGLFKLCGDQNLKGRYENDQSGYRLVFSFSSAVTGEGADVLVVDDPLKAQDADGQQRERVNEIYDNTLSTRANDPRAARRVIIMQRLHEDDLTGHLLAKMQQDGAPYYEHLCLPTEYAPRLFVPFHERADPRRTPGELLWPARFGEKENAAAKVNLGQRGYAGQHDQRPAPAGGNIYQAAWWQAQNRYDLRREEAGQVVGRWLSWDTALKDREQHDSSALTVWELLSDYRLRLRHAGWHRLQFPQLASAIQDEARRWMADGRLRGILIEDKASGISALQTLEQSAAPEIASLLKPFQPGTLSKLARARQASLWCERGCILLPEPCDEVPWLYEFEQMLYKFPAARLNDPADSLAQAILYLENLLAEGWHARQGVMPSGGKSAI